MNRDPLTAIQMFVAGDLSPAEFGDRLNSEPAFETVLSNDPHLSAGDHVQGSVYLYVLGQDLSTPSGALNTQAALAQFMDRNAIPYRSTRKYADLLNTIRRAEPKWLDVSDRWLSATLLPKAGTRSGRELEEWLKAELLRAFRYVKRPPKWLQSPAWPINEHGPLVFLGQFEVDGYFHDLAKVYVFHDARSDTYQTIVQTM